MKRKHIVTTFLLFFGLAIVGCGGNDNGSGSLRAVLSVQESPNVPGRIRLDPRKSTPGEGQKLVSFTIEVSDTATGETVFGPKTVSAKTDSALLREYFPTGAYMARLTVTAIIVVIDEGAAIRNGGLEPQFTDTVEETFSVDANIAFPKAGSCEATCSGSSTTPGQTACTLSTDCFTVGLVNDVLNQAKLIDSKIIENTTMWIQAYGSSGGSGTDNTFGGDGGASGAGGFAQTITSISGYDSQFSTTTIFYYLGEAGTHDDSGGSGGASTIISSVEPPSGNPIVLSGLVSIAGGGGGGGEGETAGPDGSAGGGGGFAYSTTEGNSNVGLGDSVTNNNTGGKDAEGGGMNKCMEGRACGGSGDGGDGQQGFGGESGGSSDNPGPRGWINGTPDLEDHVGQGGNASGGSTCDGGGGGGGFGGGGAGETITDGQCGGGAGGGSYAAASTTTDSDAPSTNPNHSGDGDIIIIFNTDPSL